MACRGGKLLQRYRKKPATGTIRGSTDIVVIPGISGADLAEQTCTHFVPWLDKFIAGFEGRVTVWIFKHDLRIETLEKWDSYSYLGASLLEELKAMSDDGKHTEDDRVVLIGHRLGGFILKKALIEAHRSKTHEQEKELLETVDLLMMLGDPHLHADNREDWISLIAGCLPAPKALSERLKLDRSIECLRAISEKFEQFTLFSSLFQVSGSQQAKPKARLKIRRANLKSSCICSAIVVTRLFSTSAEQQTMAERTGIPDVCAFHDKSPQYHNLLEASDERFLPSMMPADIAMPFVECLNAAPASTTTCCVNSEPMILRLQEPQAENACEVSLSLTSNPLGECECNTGRQDYNGVRQLQDAPVGDSGVSIHPSTAAVGLVSLPQYINTSSDEAGVEMAPTSHMQRSVSEKGKLVDNVPQRIVLADPSVHRKSEEILEVVSSNNDGSQSTQSASRVRDAEGTTEVAKPQEGALFAEDHIQPPPEPPELTHQVQSFAVATEDSNGVHAEALADVASSDAAAEERDSKSRLPLDVGAGTGNAANPPAYTTSNHDPQDTCFGREGTLQQIQRWFGHTVEDVSDESRPLLKQRCVYLWGVGGVGKSQIALEFANQSRHNYVAVLWLSANNAVNLAQSYHNAARAVGVAGEQNKHDHQKSRAELLLWLTRCQRPWLLVFDDVENLGILRDFWPSSLTGNVLVTSRVPPPQPNNFHTDEVLSLEVCNFTKDVATAFLKTIAPTAIDLTDPQAAEILATQLGGYPLALRQAAAFINSRGMSFTEYLQAFCERRSFRELASQPSVSSRHAGHQSASSYIELAFELNWSSLSEEAVAVMTVLTFLDSGPVPDSLLLSAQGIGATNLTHFPRSHKAYLECRAELWQGGICTISPDRSSWRVQKTTRDDCRHRLNPVQFKDGFRTACELLLAQWPSRRKFRSALEANWPEFDAIHSNVHSLEKIYTQCHTSPSPPRANASSRFRSSRAWVRQDALTNDAFVRLLVYSTWFNRHRGNEGEDEALFGLACRLLSDSSLESADTRRLGYIEPGHLVSLDDIDHVQDVVQRAHAIGFREGFVQGANARQKVLPKRLINVGDESASKIYLRTVTEDVPYLCLSYTWAGSMLKSTKGNLESHMQGVSIDSLPAFFRTAIDSTRRLGHQFLWIDAYCIVQDDPTEMEDESKVVQIIYANAVATITAPQDHPALSRAEKEVALSSDQAESIQLTEDITTAEKFITEGMKWVKSQRENNRAVIVFVRARDVTTWGAFQKLSHAALETYVKASIGLAIAYTVGSEPQAALDTLLYTDQLLRRQWPAAGQERQLIHGRLALALGSCYAESDSSATGTCYASLSEALEVFENCLETGQTSSDWLAVTHLKLAEQHLKDNHYQVAHSHIQHVLDHFEPLETISAQAHTCRAFHCQARIYQAEGITFRARRAAAAAKEGWLLVDQLRHDSRFPDTLHRELTSDDFDEIIDEIELR